MLSPPLFQKTLETPRILTNNQYISHLRQVGALCDPEWRRRKPDDDGPRD